MSKSRIDCRAVLTPNEPPNGPVGIKSDSAGFGKWPQGPLCADVMIAIGPMRQRQTCNRGPKCRDCVAGQRTEIGGSKIRPAAGDAGDVLNARAGFHIKMLAPDRAVGQHALDLRDMRGIAVLEHHRSLAVRRDTPQPVADDAGDPEM